MHPILLQVGSLKLYTYGFFVALGFIIAIWFTKRNARFYGVPDQMVSDLFFTVLISALAGARILYVLINLDAYRDNFFDIFKIWNGGLVFFGGFIGGTLGAYIFTHQKTGYLENRRCYISRPCFRTFRWAFRLPFCRVLLRQILFVAHCHNVYQPGQLSPP